MIYKTPALVLDDKSLVSARIEQSANPLHKGLEELTLQLSDSLVSKLASLTKESLDKNLSIAWVYKDEVLVNATPSSVIDSDYLTVTLTNLEEKNFFEQLPLIKKKHQLLETNQQISKANVEQSKNLYPTLLLILLGTLGVSLLLRLKKS